MLALEILLLTGRYVATRHNDRQRAEWPPHPARLYSALVAALHDNDPVDIAERDALLLLEQAGAPEILASRAEMRQVTDVYVPVNDPKALASIDKALMAWEDAEQQHRKVQNDGSRKALARKETALEKASTRSMTASSGKLPTGGGAAQLLPDSRSRQPRTFPTAIPECERVRFEWPALQLNGAEAALDRLAARVGRLGHSSSLVALRVTQSIPVSEGMDRWIPDNAGTEQLRAVEPGQLQRLEAAHERHQQVDPRVLPALPVRYRIHEYWRTPFSGTVPARSVFSATDWTLYRVVTGEQGRSRGIRPHLSLTEDVARAFRTLFLSGSADPLPPSLSGHEESGQPALDPHLAFVPLADVGHPHASGMILGVAVIPPRALDVVDRDRLVDVLANLRGNGAHEHVQERPADRLLRIQLGHGEVLHLERVADEGRRALQPLTWTRASRRWATVTPIALDRNPGRLTQGDPETRAGAWQKAEEMIGQACVNAGLPLPVEVIADRRSVVDGTVAARRFMPTPRPGHGNERACVHATVEFDRPVEGPLLIGAGRFVGIGLMRPLRERAR